MLGATAAPTVRSGSGKTVALRVGVRESGSAAERRGSTGPLSEWRSSMTTTESQSLTSEKKANLQSGPTGSCTRIRSIPYAVL